MNSDTMYSANTAAAEEPGGYAGHHTEGEGEKIGDIAAALKKEA